jgi:myosin protein heavy chain
MNIKNLLKVLQVYISKYYLLLQTHIQNLNEELEAERTTRAKVERERDNLTQDLEDLSERLEESGGTSLAQMEITKKQEARFQKLQRDMEEAMLHFEATSTSLKKRHADSLAELESQIENLQQAKQKLEHDKSDLQLEVDDLLTEVEQMTRAKVDTPKLFLWTYEHRNR